MGKKNIDKQKTLRYFETTPGKHLTVNKIVTRSLLKNFGTFIKFYWLVPN